MAFKLGNNDVTFKVGSGDCTIYLGTELLYEPSFSGKFYATYSDGSSYSVECDSFKTLSDSTTKPSGYEYSAMTEAIVGDCITEINGSTFINCKSLTSVILPSGLTRIQDWKAFQGCSSLVSITIPSGVTSIGSYTFSGCSSLNNINIPSGVTRISDGVFSNCYGLTSIDIPDSVTKIGQTAFYMCSGLTSIEIPDSVTNIGTQAFISCKSLTSITVNATTPPTLGTNVFAYTNDCPIYVPSESVETYKAASGWSTYASRIQAIPS